MNKLDIEVSAGQILKSATVNAITRKVDDIVDEVNKLPDMNVSIRENRRLIEAMKEEQVYLSQEAFKDLQEQNKLDPDKTYYTYEQ